MCILSGLSGCELVALASTIAVAISKDIPNDELALWGAFFTTLGDNLSLIATTSTENDK